jgi:ATP-dependent DNA helicase PIF1
MSSSSSSLSPDQQVVYDAVVTRRQSVFLTGCAGTGKSFLLLHMIQALMNKNRTKTTKLRVFVTATTGIAAIPLNGCTLHSFASIGFGAESKEELAKKVKKSYMGKKRWEQCDVLIIDEVSMLDGALFDKLEHIAREVRGNNLPFGGIQLILTGDFLQLPPVNPQKGFCFEADSWSHCIKPETSFQLTTVFRQQDKVFVSILNELRKGVVSPESIQALNACLNRSFQDRQDIDKIEATLLYARKAEVLDQNQQRLNQLTTPPMRYTAVDNGPDSNAMAQMQKNSPAPEVMVLKEGCQVILIYNHDTSIGLANGSRGVVIGFEVDKDNSSDAVSFSRIQSDQKWPRVRFTNGQEVVIKPHEWKIEMNGEVKARRTQIPFILGYAITIHKCQGMTLDRVKLDLDSTFEYGQSYVALSRAKKLEDLCLINRVNAAMFRAHPKALEFYQQYFPEKEERQTITVQISGTWSSHSDVDIGTQNPEESITRIQRNLGLRFSHTHAQRPGSLQPNRRIVPSCDPFKE